jgi:hypothetical protein
MYEGNGNMEEKYSIAKSAFGGLYKERHLTHDEPDVVGSSNSLDMWDIRHKLRPIAS